MISSIAYPTSVKPITRRQMQRPGGMKYHHAPAETAPDSFAVSSIVPHEGG